MNESASAYKIDFTDKFFQHIEKHRISGRKKIPEKINTLLEELTEHPYTGTGRPEPLTQDKKGKWSRRITGKHRLIYNINEETATVTVASAFGHYDDK
jgi:toxin YoeB